MTVAVEVDYPEAARAALRLAAQEARWRQAALIVVGAYEPPIGSVGGSASSPWSDKHADTQRRLVNAGAAALAVLAREGPPPTSLID